MSYFPPPSPEAWDRFVIHLLILAHSSDQRPGEPDDRNDIVGPFNALGGLLVDYDARLMAGAGRLMKAVYDSMEGNPHPLFKPTAKRSLSIDKAIVRGLAARAVRDFSFGEEKTKIQIIEAAQTVLLAIKSGNRGYKSDMTAKTIVQWHKNLRKAAAGDRGKYSRPNSLALQIYLSDQEKPREQRCLEAINYLCGAAPKPGRVFAPGGG